MITFVPAVDKEGVVEAVAGTARNITERKAAEEKNWQRANYDLLTGLPNRRLFLDRLEQDLKHAGRIGAPISLLFIDLDHFKEVNDKFGHDAGDLLLRLVTARLLSCIRDTDTVARLSGDEFTVILQDLRGTEDVELIAGKILTELASPFPIFSHTVHISASIGITLSPQDASTPDHLIKNADQAMYVAKKAGRNQFSFFSPN
ncbi:diguanylate cyclase domain-containing protein [Undibacterium arcticum]|uniref:diguanylate cyclase domain-containing protein n=1 Tax=Undibacterium arcticum TaxID=1762892 RepID=UPI00360EED7F